MKTFITLIALIGLVGCGNETTTDPCSVSDECVPEVVDEFCEPCIEFVDVTCDPLPSDERTAAYELGREHGYEIGFHEGADSVECDTWQDAYDAGYEQGSFDLQHCNYKFERLLVLNRDLSDEIYACQCDEGYIHDNTCEPPQ